MTYDMNDSHSERVNRVRKLLKKNKEHQEQQRKTIRKRESIDSIKVLSTVLGFLAIGIWGVSTLPEPNYETIKGTVKKTTNIGNSFEGRYTKITLNEYPQTIFQIYDFHGNHNTKLYHGDSIQITYQPPLNSIEDIVNLKY